MWDFHNADYTENSFEFETEECRVENLTNWQWRYKPFLGSHPENESKE
jgi:hypothetical protein